MQVGVERYHEPTAGERSSEEECAALEAKMAAAVAAWTGQLVDLGGRNTLLYYRDLKQGTLALDDADPVATGCLLGSRTIRLSSLFDANNLAVASRRARTVRAKAAENFEERGLQTLFLAWGMATWTNTRGTAIPAAPVLLRQAHFVPRGGAEEDFDLSLPGEWEVNPTLLHLLSVDHDVQVDAASLLDLLNADAETPDAQPIFDRLTKEASGVAGFGVIPRAVLGNFSYAKLPMVKDLETAGELLAASPLAAAIAGDEAAREVLRSRHPAGLREDSPDHAPPADEFLVLDADASQSYVINAAVSGADLVCLGPPGTGKSQTIANLIATLSARNKKVLFVAEKRAAIDAVLSRLNAVGLADLVMDLHDGPGSRRLLAQQLSRALAAASWSGATKVRFSGSSEATLVPACELAVRYPSAISCSYASSAVLREIPSSEASHLVDGRTRARTHPPAENLPAERSVDLAVKQPFLIELEKHCRYRRRPRTQIRAQISAAASQLHDETDYNPFNRVRPGGLL